MCSPDRDHLADWLAGWLDPAAAKRVSAHVSICPACRAEADALTELATAVRAHAAHRAETVAVPAYRQPRPLPNSPRLGVFASIRRNARPFAPATARLRLAAGLMAAVAVAVGAVAWRGGGLTPTERRAADRPQSSGAVALAPSVPTVVLRQPTAVHRVADVQRVASAEPPARISAAPQSAAPQAARVALAPPQPPARVDERRPDAPSWPSATAVAPATESAGPSTPPTDPAPPPTTDVPFPPPSPTSQTPSTPVPPPTSSSPVATPTAVVPTIAGLVIGADGAPLAGARVIAEPFEGDVTLDAQTGPDGRYAIDVTPGRWHVHAEAAGYALMWRGGAPSPQVAEALDVADGTSRVAVDFALEPAPGVHISGRVVDAAGNGVPGALVVAARPGDRAVDVGQPLAAVYADDDGAYSLPITPGGWLVAATTDWRHGTLAWWGGDGSISQADRVPVDAGNAVDGIDLLIRP